MYIIKAQTYGHWGSWDDFVGIFENLEDAEERMREHAAFYDLRFKDIVWEQGDEGLVFDPHITYTAIKVELT